VEVDVRLDQVVLRALEKEPERRYQQASEVKTDLETIAVTPANRASVPESPGRPRKYKLWWIALPIAILCLLIGWRSFQATRRQGDPSQLTQEGWQLWQSRRLAEATAKFSQAVKLAPEDANAWNGLGWASFNSGQSAAAEKAFQKVVSLEPNHPAALNGLGQIYLSQGRYDLAETNLLKASPQASAAWYGLARLYLLQGKFEQAEKWARKVVDSGQGDEVARRMLQAAQEQRLSDDLRMILEPKLAR
jgi:tetratricopeptide (TPR) repeat protein